MAKLQGDSLKGWMNIKSSLKKKKEKLLFGKHADEQDHKKEDLKQKLQNTKDQKWHPKKETSWTVRKNETKTTK